MHPFCNLHKIYFGIVFFFPPVHNQATIDVITNNSMNKRFCQSDNNCRRGERCEKICFWLYSNDDWLGCKIACVRLPDSKPSFLVKSSSNVDPNPTTTSSPSIEENLDKYTNGFNNWSTKKISSAFTLIDDDPNTVTERTKPAFLFGNCPYPTVCDKDCGTFLDLDGCQKCLCIEKGPIACNVDITCYSWQACYNGICRCKRGYEESLVNPGQCLPKTFSNPSTVSNSDFRIGSLTNNLNGKPVPIKLTDIVQDNNSLSKANIDRKPVENGKGNLTDKCEEDKNCSNDLVCCSKVYCDLLNNCKREKVCLQHCLTPR